MPGKGCWESGRACCNTSLTWFSYQSTGKGSSRTVKQKGVPAGRLVTVCLARDSGKVESLLRVEARPFIAAHLRDVFSRRPISFHGVELHLAHLFNARCLAWHALTLLRVLSG